MYLSVSLLGAHILQRMCGCVWDEKTGQNVTFLKYGYDGEDFIELDLKNKTWVALKPQADIIKEKWDADKLTIMRTERFFTDTCLPWVKNNVDYGKRRTGTIIRPEAPD